MRQKQGLYNFICRPVKKSLGGSSPKGLSVQKVMSLIFNFMKNHTSKALSRKNIFQILEPHCKLQYTLLLDQDIERCGMVASEKIFTFHSVAEWHLGMSLLWIFIAFSCSPLICKPFQPAL